MFYSLEIMCAWNGFFYFVFYNGYLRVAYAFKVYM